MAEHFVARVSRGRTAVLILGALAFVGAGIWLVADPAGIAASSRVLDDPGLVQMVGIASILLFGLFAVIGARQLFRTDPVIEIGPEGLLWRRWSSDPIPWEAFERAEIGQIQRQRMLTFWLRDPEAYRSGGFMGRTAGMNKALGFGDITLNMAGLDGSFDALTAAARRFAPQLFGR